MFLMCDQRVVKLRFDIHILKLNCVCVCGGGERERGGGAVGVKVCVFDGNVGMCVCV